jgi:hypothetical protein
VQQDATIQDTDLKLDLRLDIFVFLHISLNFVYMSHAEFLRYQNVEINMPVMLFARVCEGICVCIHDMIYHCCRNRQVSDSFNQKNMFAI